VMCRDSYLDKLARRKHKGLGKVIAGIYRCGKSYLLNHIFIITCWSLVLKLPISSVALFDSAGDLYSIGESLIRIEKEKLRVDSEKFMAYIRFKCTDAGM